MLRALRHYVQGVCWPIPAAMAALMTLSVLAVRLAEQVDSDLAGFATKQTIFAGVALAGFVAASAVHYERIGRASALLAAFTLASLAAVFAFPPVNGSQRWIPTPGPLKFQPSELAKLVYIITLAWYLRYRSNYRRLAGLVAPFLMTLVPLGLILTEPDLGTALLLLPTLMAMLLLAGARLRHFLVIGGLGALVILWPMPRGVDVEQFERQRSGFIASRLGPVTFYTVDESLDWPDRPVTPVAYCRVQVGNGRPYDIGPFSLWFMERRSPGSYQVRRIAGWLRQGDPRIIAASGYQQHWSMLILGSGRWIGRGTWQSTDAYFSMLPDDHTDFIFAVIGGQWGFAGCATVLGLYAVIFLFGADVAASTRDPFGRLLAAGVLALLAAQIFINIGMTTGLMPVTGMTLPLVSYGGSSLLINGMALGLLVNVGRHRPRSLAPTPFEFDEPD
ncbi:MAG: rod shape-determining protein RodA [Planctomycetes bacterium]|nr:rod shape-determining protein RodA [Planctomycetota bacterium]